MKKLTTTTEPERRPLPDLATNQLVWIFEAAREHFSESVRNMMDEVVRLGTFPDTGPLADSSWTRRQKSAADLIEDRQESIKRLLPVIEFCDVARERFADMSAQEFGAAFRDYLNGKKTGGAK